MAIDVYLALTAGEFAKETRLPEKAAWMACHFAPGSEGLSNYPGWLPEKSMLIVDDSCPIQGHRPELVHRTILDLVLRHGCTAVVLDFQRPGAEEMVTILSKGIPCPVAVSAPYSSLTGGPVLLPPVPLNKSPEGHILPWSGREIWLELDAGGCAIALTSRETVCAGWWPEGDTPHHNGRLHCSYRIQLDRQQATFLLRRTPSDLHSLLQEAQTLGVTTALGLYREFPEYAEKKPLCKCRAAL